MPKPFRDSNTRIDPDAPLRARGRPFRQRRRCLEATPSGGPALAAGERGHAHWYGHELLRDGQVAAALKLFRAIVLVFPDSPRAHDSLGGAHEAAHETAAAIAAYETALVKLKASPHVPPQVKLVVRARLEKALIKLRAAR